MAKFFAKAYEVADKMVEAAWWAGYWHGFVTCAVVVLVLWVFGRKQS